MPEIAATEVPPMQQKLDRQLLLSLMLSPVAAGISTIVGYIVAHWVTITAYKRTGYLVSGICFALCLMSALLGWNARQKLNSPDEALPKEGCQLFMAKLALLISALCTLVVLAGTLVLITLRPND